MTDTQTDPLERIAAALEMLAGTAEAAAPDFSNDTAFVWQARKLGLQPVPHMTALPLSLLVGVERQAHILFENTRRFADGKPANNALLWGARGMGKSSLVKAVHAAVGSSRLKLIEIYREDLPSLPVLLNLLAKEKDFQFLLFCDDLSFDVSDAGYKSLKAVLEGGVAGRPHNVLFYATSNRRHLMPRDMVENEQRTGIHPSEAVEEKVSLSDRFGLWLGFHGASQPDYLEMIDRYAAWGKINMPKEELHRAALEWATTRGSRSGRVAWQFIQSVL